LQEFVQASEHSSDFVGQGGGFCKELGVAESESLGDD
jgi:hypothetical protein